MLIKILSPQKILLHYTYTYFFHYSPIIFKYFLLPCHLSSRIKKTRQLINLGPMHCLNETVFELLNNTILFLWSNNCNFRYIYICNNQTEMVSFYLDNDMILNHVAIMSLRRRGAVWIGFNFIRQVYLQRVA